MNFNASDVATLRYDCELPLSAHSLSALPAPKLDRAYLPFDVEAASVVLRFVDGSRMMIPAADLLDPKALLHFADRIAPLSGTGFQDKVDVAAELPQNHATNGVAEPQRSQAARFFDVAETACIHVEHNVPVEVVVNPHVVCAGIAETVGWFQLPAQSCTGQILHNDNPPHVFGNSFGDLPLVRRSSVA